MGECKREIGAELVGALVTEDSGPGTSAAEVADGLTRDASAATSAISRCVERSAGLRDCVTSGGKCDCFAERRFGSARFGLLELLEGDFREKSESASRTPMP